MTTTTAIRRLAAILTADVAGYSRLMGADEEGTHERVKAHLREVVEPKISEHHGRIVKTTGDGVLANSPASSMRYAVRPKSRMRWPAAICICRRSVGYAFGWASISAT